MSKPKRTRGGSKPHRGQVATEMLRVRMTPKEKAELLDCADNEFEVSEYVRLALRRYHAVFCMTSVLEEDLKKRALTTFECNLLATVNPTHYLHIGGAELTKAPEDRRRAE